MLRERFLNDLIILDLRHLTGIIIKRSTIRLNKENSAGYFIILIHNNLCSLNYNI